LSPQFKTAGSPIKKIVDDEVKIIVTGTSSLTPKEPADCWESSGDCGQEPESRSEQDHQ
jgi:hypothetical protein